MKCGSVIVIRHNQMQAAIDTLETFWPTRDNFFEVIRNLSYV
jgi:hypothetical protein